MARGVLFEPNKLHDQWAYLKPPQWVVLNFDYSDLSSVNGGGKVYRGIQIGKHESSP